MRMSGGAPQAGVLGTGVQLPVGKGPGAALAELDIGLRVQKPRGPKTLHIRLTRLHGAAPLQEDGPLARLRQHQGGEEPRRARSHHDGRDLRRWPDRRGAVLRPRFQEDGLLTPAAPEDGGLIVHRHPNGVHHRRRLPRVHAAAENLEFPDIPRPEAEQPGGLGAEFRLAAAGGEANAFELNHGKSPFAELGPG